MKALVYTGKKNLDFKDYNDPIQKAGEEIIEIKSVGICGSDMHAFLGHDERRPAPLILGHEPAGIIVGGSNNGKKVTINPLVTCGKCKFCLNKRDNLCLTRQIISMPPREGAFAQFVSMPKENLVFLPDKISLDKACLAEPLACGWHSVRIAEETLKTEIKKLKCLIIGGGAIGIGSALSLKAYGAKDIYLAETNLIRHNQINKSCEMEVFDPSKGYPIKEGSADLVIDGVGLKSTREIASKFVSPGGLIMHIGLGEAKDGLDIRRMTLQEISFIGTYTYTSQDFKDTAEAIFDGRLGTLNWTEIRPLKDGQNCFDEILKGNSSSPKIILKP